MITEPSVAVSALEKQKLSILIPLVRITEDPNGAKDPQLGASTAHSSSTVQTAD